MPTEIVRTSFLFTQLCVATESRTVFVVVIGQLFACSSETLLLKFCAVLPKGSTALDCFHQRFGQACAFGTLTYSGTQHSQSYDSGQVVSRGLQSSKAIASVFHVFGSGSLA